LRWLDATPSAEKVKNEDDDGEDEENVDPRAHGINADDTQKPQNYEDDGDSPKHCWPPEVRLRLDTSASAQKVEDEDDHCQNEQDVNEAAADVEGEA
jgi:hypothetical protein